MLTGVEAPVAMLKPGHGESNRAYLWSSCTTAWDDIMAVILDFAEIRVGQNAKRLLGNENHGSGVWHGALVADGCV